MVNRKYVVKLLKTDLKDLDDEDKFLAEFLQLYVKYLKKVNEEIKKEFPEYKIDWNEICFYAHQITHIPLKKGLLDEIKVDYQYFILLKNAKSNKSDYII